MRVYERSFSCCRGYVGTTTTVTNGKFAILESLLNSISDITLVACLRRGEILRRNRQPSPL